MENLVFHKFRLKRKSWITSSNFNIYDEDGKIINVIKYNPWSFKPKIVLKDQNGMERLRAEAKNSFQTKFTIIEGEEPIAEVKINHFSRESKIMISEYNSDDIRVQSNTWSSEFKYFRQEDEIAFLSYKIWSSGDMGIVIKGTDSKFLILMTGAIIAILKQSGSL